MKDRRVTSSSNDYLTDRTRDPMLSDGTVVEDDEIEDISYGRVRSSKQLLSESQSNFLAKAPLTFNWRAAGIISQIYL